MWSCDGSRIRTVYLAEDATALPAGPARAESFDDVLDQRSVLWGKPEAGESNGFSVWSEGRISRAHYPCPPVMISLLNLTPHTVVVLVGERRVEIAASGMVATVAEERSRCGSVPVDGLAVPVWRVRTGTVTGLPTTEPGRWLTTSVGQRITRRWCSGPPSRS